MNWGALYKYFILTGVILFKFHKRSLPQKRTPFSVGIICLARLNKCVCLLTARGRLAHFKIHSQMLLHVSCCTLAQHQRLRGTASACGHQSQRYKRENWSSARVQALQTWMVLKRTAMKINERFSSIFLRNTSYIDDDKWLEGEASAHVSFSCSVWVCVPLC